MRRSSSTETTSNDASDSTTVGRYGARRYRLTEMSISSGLSGMMAASRCSDARSESALGLNSETEYPGTFSASTSLCRS